LVLSATTQGPCWRRPVAIPVQELSGLFVERQRFDDSRGGRRIVRGIPLEHRHAVKGCACSCRRPGVDSPGTERSNHGKIAAEPTIPGNRDGFTDVEDYI